MVRQNRKPKDDPIIVQMDLGNSAFKIVVLDTNGDRYETEMPHDIELLSDAKWSIRQKRAKVQKARVESTQVLQLARKVDKEWQYTQAVVGREAQLGSNSSKKVGSNKYIYGYMDVILCAALLEVLPPEHFPNGHDNIYLGIGYPTTEINHLDKLATVISSKPHRVRDVYGNELVYKIRKLIPTDEALGALLQYQDRVQHMNYFDLNAGDRILWIDVGGRIGSIGSVVMQMNGALQPLYDEVEAINMGIINTFDALRNTLNYWHSDDFVGMDIDDSMLLQALTKQEVRLSGSRTPIDVSQAVIDATDILREIERIYNMPKFGRGRAYKGIILTGGGVAALHVLLTDILDHEAAYPADDISEIQFANVRGGLLATIAALIADDMLPENYADVFYAIE